MSEEHAPPQRQHADMAADDYSADLANIVAGLATRYNPSADHTFTTRFALDRTKVAKIALPGADSSEKQSLERELNALAARIEYLEAKAYSSSQASLPITPSEPESSPFASQGGTPGRAQNTSETPRPRSASLVNQLLTKKESPNGDAAHQLTEEQLQILREHVEEQATQIKSQSEYIDSINDKLEQQQRATREALGGIETSVHDVETLKREVSKNQQINMTYQKVLREIGSIVTAVANGDLSKKVLISAKERDPEIATFKRTINRMVDQLQDFASQVTHLAKEVGTEGRLGGQAVLPGVDGIWAELTQNGT